MLEIIVISLLLFCLVCWYFWHTEPNPKSKQEPINVGRSIIEIEYVDYTDGNKVKTTELEFTGKYLDIGEFSRTFYSSEYASNFLEKCGSKRLLYVGDNLYIPYRLVNYVKVKHEDYYDTDPK